MLPQRAVLIAVVVAGYGPAITARATDLAALAPAEVVLYRNVPSPVAMAAPASVVTPAIAAPATVAAPVMPAPQPGGIRPDATSTGLKYNLHALLPPLPESAGGDVAAPHHFEGVRYYGLDRAPEDYRLSSSSRIESALSAAPISVMNRTGWNWSGRIGPVRWLGPLDGEGGDMLLRLGRVPGQPRMSGMGKFNVGVHYTFE